MANEWNLGEKKRALVKEIETAVIVSVVTQEQSMEQAVEYLDELEFLALTAGAQVKQRFMQKLRHPDNRTFVGKGKAEEINEYVKERYS